MNTGASPMPTAPVSTPTKAPTAQCRAATRGRSVRSQTLSLNSPAANLPRPVPASEAGGSKLVVSSACSTVAGGVRFRQSWAKVRGHTTQQSTPAKASLRVASGASDAKRAPRVTPGSPKAARHAATARSQPPPRSQTAPPERADTAWEPRLEAVACSCVSPRPGMRAIPWMLMMPDPKPAAPVTQPAPRDNGTASSNCATVAPPSHQASVCSGRSWSLKAALARPCWWASGSVRSCSVPELGASCLVSQPTLGNCTDPCVRDAACRASAGRLNNMSLPSRARPRRGRGRMLARKRWKEPPAIGSSVHSTASPRGSWDGL
mmetsp:Transcript_128367/g.357330  ORF Transcript_128367/g.357330 Transcript_128367/m.357330 type:complete len:320 (-) Transcript_128367:13-972(-)